ncbi:MAG: DUF2933 domain-containing protein [Gemmatimonadaceae bacterium]
MLWLRENWFWIVVSVAFVWMHVRMHGGHGGHGHHTHSTSARKDDDHDQH